MERFRTRSGQTGMDAYVYELTAIANAQRELNARFETLVETVRNEHPEYFGDEATAFSPMLNVLDGADAGAFRDFLLNNRDALNSEV